MTTFADKIEAASADQSLSSDDLRALLRRAALAIRNAESASIDPAWEKALDTAMIDLRAFNGNEAIRYIVGEWLRTNGYLSWDSLEIQNPAEAGLCCHHGRFAITHP